MELTTTDVMQSQLVLVGFEGSSLQAVGRIPLIVFTPPHNLLVDLVVIDAPPIYNMIKGVAIDPLVGRSFVYLSPSTEVPITPGYDGE